VSTIHEIEEAIRQLSRDDRAAVRAWLAELDAVEWDQQLETDVAAGRLDWLAEEARQDLKSGRCTDR
jgi:hypothetical protein